MDSRTFLDNLKVSGLLLDEQVDAVSGRFSNSAMEIVVNDLVDEGLLTSFQVKQLHAGQSKGLVLGQYHLLDELGRGGYGCVYKARHKLMNRIVALKVIAPERVEDSHARAWFRREVLAATQLIHPNIALVYDADEIDGILFFAMEFIDGLNLDSLVRQHGPVPIGTACEMMLQTAKALQYAHETGMVHRDIKPANLLIPRDTIAEAAADFSPRGVSAVRPVLVKVVDFGLARLQTSSSNNTLVLQNERSFVGTPAYVSPEQARNVHEVDIRSDLYSLGCTFYHALAGQQPFQASSPMQIVVQHLEREAEPIENLRPETPPALASIIRRLMAKKPEKRFQSPSELLSELGFFYALDRSGIQRSIPFPSSGGAGNQPAKSDSSSERAILLPVERSRIAAASAAAPPSEYSPTRVLPLDAEKKLIDDGAVRPVHSRQDAEMPRTMLVPTEGEVTAVGVTVSSASMGQDAVNDGSPCKPGADLLRLWQTWASVVADLASGRTPALDDAAYRVLHRRLLDECKTRAASSDPKHAALHGRIADVAQPWLTLATLSGADHETLTSLHTQCQAIDERLGVRPSSYAWIIGVLLILFAVGAGYFVLQSVGGRSPSSWLAWIQRQPVVALVIVIPSVLIAFALLLGKLLRTSRAS